MFFDFPFFIIAIVLLVGLIVMLLWNAVLPNAIHVSKINYWQALGLLVLCRILFGGFRGRPGYRRPEMWRGRGHEWREKWKNMSDEERMKFREEWRQRCRRPGPGSEPEQ
jgi:hypothetical protein